MKRWYARGLRFSCQPDCHRCCRREGIVQLGPADGHPDGELRRLAAAVKLMPAEFRRDFVHHDRLNGDYMEDGPHGGCPLWHDGCAVYAARPMQCVTYPFWPEVIRSRRSWEREARLCPGIGQGRLFSADEIAALAMASV